MPIKSSTVKYLSNPVINVPRNRHPSVFFTVVSEKKKKWKHGISWRLPTMKKSALLKNRDFNFSLVLVMKFSFISSFLGKVKVFSVIIACLS